MKAEDVLFWMEARAKWEGKSGRPAARPGEQADAIRALIAERDALLEERQRFEARLFDIATTGDQARAERDALRALLAAARAYMLGAGDSYENEVVMAISATLESNTKT